MPFAFTFTNPATATAGGRHQPATHPRHGQREGVRRTEHAAHDSEQAEGVMHGHGPRDGRLTPRADPVTGTLGWQALTVSRRTAVAVAGVCGGTVHPLGKGEWQARIPETDIAVIVAGADSRALWCRLGSEPGSPVLTVAVKPWTIATVLKCPVTALPASGKLSVREARVTTRMSRTVRYLIPEFTPS
jgi:hypothetical protein